MPETVATKVVASQPSKRLTDWNADHSCQKNVIFKMFIAWNWRLL